MSWRDSGVVLVLAEVCDATATMVVDVLKARGVTVCWADTAEFPEKLSLVASPHSTDRLGYLIFDDQVLDLATVRSIYRRSPARFRFPDGMSVSERRFATSEAVYGLGGVLACLPCRWVDHPGKVADASYKPHQLHVAAACGLRVPRTLITNVAAKAREFAIEVGGNVVYKSLSGGVISEQNTLKLLHTTPLSYDDLDDPAIELTSNMFQEWVPKAYDVRLTTVGNRSFAVAIHAASPGARIDWRKAYDDLTYEVCDPPGDVRHGVLKYLRTFGLTFGAFDFSVTPDGVWWFLECNANGQWGWLAEETGLPIADAIADELTVESA